MNLSTADRPWATYHAETPWGAWRASVATLIVVALSILVPVALVLTFGVAANSDASSPLAWGPLVLSQLIMGVGALWLAGRYGGRRWQVLALQSGPLPLARLALYFAIIASTSLAYTFAIYSVLPEVVRADMDTFKPMVRSAAWPVYALIIAVGAPLSEELLFRGFLQSALSRSRLGYIGASIITTVAWTMLHFQYSIYGLAEIAVVGLAFCWILWRTGTLWSTILLHAVYNGIQFVSMKLSLFPWT